LVVSVSLQKTGEAVASPPLGISANSFPEHLRLTLLRGGETPSESGIQVCWACALLLNEGDKCGREVTYRTATVTVLLGVALITTRTGTALPGAVPWGIFTLINHNPTDPALRPENWTAPNVLLPMATHMEGCEVTQAVPSAVGTATVVGPGYRQARAGSPGPDRSRKA